MGGVAATIDEANSKISVSTLDYLMDLSKLKVTGLAVTGSATASIANNADADFSKPGTKITLTSPDGSTRDYSVNVGYQYTNNDFKSWNGNEATGWSNGNTAGFNMTSPNLNGGAKMESMNATIVGIGQFASGNIFTGYFNPLNVGNTDMLNKYPDGNELIDFGKPFKARPEFVEIDFTYEGKGDSCDLYVILENRTRTANEGKNAGRGSSDVNTLIASAWYRSTTQDNTGRSNPDVVSIEKNSAGSMTLRMKMQYGKPLAGSPIENSNTFKTTLENASGIDNHLVQGTGNEDVTHLRFVMASSANGNYYEGTVGAMLIVYGVRFIY